MSNTVTQATTIVGGYTKYGPVTPEAQKIFNKVFPDGLHGNAIYEPYEVATQVVAGINYKYKCSVQPKNPDNLIIWEATVVIYQPLEGEPVLMSINPI